jgi:CRISPR-associated protein Cas1
MIKRTIEISSGPTRLSIRNRQLVIDREGQETATVPAEDIGLLLVDHQAVT